MTITINNLCLLSAFCGLNTLITYLDYLMGFSPKLMRVDAVSSHFVGKSTNTQVRLFAYAYSIPLGITASFYINSGKTSPKRSSSGCFPSLRF